MNRPFFVYMSNFFVSLMTGAVILSLQAAPVSAANGVDSPDINIDVVMVEDDDIHLDGKLDDPCWAKAKAYEGRFFSA